MKKLLVIIIILLVAVLMTQTVPDKKAHKEAMMEEVKEYVAEEADERYGDNVLTGIGKSVVVKTIEVVLNTKLKVDNYYLFNTTHVKMNGEKKTLSLGILGNVITFDKEMLRENLEAAAKEKEEAAEEKAAAKASAKELKRLKKEQKKREKELKKEQKRREKEAKKKQKEAEKQKKQQ